MKNILDECDIWIVKDNIKNNIFEKHQGEMLNHKIISFSEFRDKYYFTYDNRAIHYLMEHYHYQYDVAKMYLSMMIYLPDEVTSMSKVEMLRGLKKELEENHLLIKNSSFVRYLKNKKVAVMCSLDDLSFFEKRIFHKLRDITDVFFYEEEYLEYDHDNIIQCHTMEEEVSYIADKIVSLLLDDIDIKEIKVCARREYYDIIRRVFSWYHIPVCLDNITLYGTSIGQFFLREMVTDKESSLENLVSRYSLDNVRNLEIYNSIIQILNRYTWCDDLISLKPFLVNDFKNCSVSQESNSLVVSVVDSLDSVSSDEYVFLLGFNQGEIPHTYKEEDYFSDKEKMLLGLETTAELNERSYLHWLREIKRVKNLVITMKKNGMNGECYLSSLNDDLHLELVLFSKSYSYSHLYNKLELSKGLDILVKYNEVVDDLSMLYSHYKNIGYRSYHHKYQGVSKNKIREYLDYHLVLSYSSLTTYYQCAFRYYLNYILRINPYEETFYTILGNAFHYVLSLVFSNDIDIRESYYHYLDGVSYIFNAREKYFLDSLEKELEFVISVIRKQLQDNKLLHLYTEEKIEIQKKHEDMDVIFKGFVDKMLLNDDSDKIAIIDYKTGNPNLNLNHIIYGLSMQLPIYVYLALYRFKDARVVGFYLQKILNTEIVHDDKKSYLSLKEEKLKLQGYSNRDLSLLKEFDPHYEDSDMILGMKMSSKGISSKKVFDDIFIDKLLDITDKKIDEAISNISNGCFDINPKKIGMVNEGCSYCQFKDICFMTESDLVYLKEYKNMEFLGGDEDDTTETK